MASKESTTTGSNLSMKLLVNSRTQRVLYAKAGKDVVDFLFSLLTLPVGTVVKLLDTASSMVGSIGNLYGSVEKLDDTYISRDDAKEALLTPSTSCQGSRLLQLPEAEGKAAAPVTGNVFRCTSLRYGACYDNVTKAKGTPCPYCSSSMGPKLHLVQRSSGSVGGGVPCAAGNGFVQGIVTYTVTDDLKVSPMSSISGITLVTTYGVTDIGSLQEMTVQIGYAEGLEILKASLQSKTVLTDVFLGKKKNKT